MHGTVPHASRVHLGVPTKGELFVMARSIARVLADSNRTLDIVVGEEVAARAQLRYLAEHVLPRTERGRALLASRPELGDTDVDALRRLPDGSLGRELARYLDAHGFDYHVDRAAPKVTEDETLAYVMRRIRKNHDIFHVLLGLGPEGHHEVLVHAFTLAQVGMPSSIAIVFFGAIKHMALEGRWACLRTAVREAYALGLRAEPLLAVRWEELWGEPLLRVRARFGIVPLETIATVA